MGKKRVKRLVNFVKSKLSDTVVNKALDHADTYVSNVINKKVKNKATRDLLKSQIQSLKPFIKQKIKEQRGGRVRRRKRRPKLRRSINNVHWF